MMLLNHPKMERRRNEENVIIDKIYVKFIVLDRDKKNLKF